MSNPKIVNIKFKFKSKKGNFIITGWYHMHILCGDVEAALKCFADIFRRKEIFPQKAAGFPMVRIEILRLVASFIGTQPQSPML